MRNIAIIILISLFTIASANAQANKESREIKKMIKAQNKAYKQGNIELAITFHHPDYLKYCDKVLHLALRADSTALMAVDLQTIDWVFSIRKRIPFDVLEEMDAQSLILYYDKLFGSKKSRFQYGSITATADSGYARIHDRNYPTPYFFRYSKIEGKWYNDRSEILDYLNSVSERNLAKQNCDPVNLYYLDLAEYYRYTCPGFDPWQPVIDK